MRILVADSFPAGHLDRLASLGHDVVSEPGLDADTLSGFVEGFEVLIVRSTRVTAEAIAAGNRLALIVRAGAGVNTIDVEAAADGGIVVSNTPGKNAIAVAELTMALIASLDRNIVENVAELRSGRWNKKHWSQATGLAGRLIGIVGFGSIGREVARRAAAFDMTVVVVDKPGRSEDAARAIEELGAVVVGDLPALLRTSDVVSLHVPAEPETSRMVNAAFLAHLRDGAMLINTSRGDIVDEAALVEAIEAKGLRVGLDVYQDEPGTGSGKFESALANHPAVYGTHHIGASTEQAQLAIADEVVAIVESFATGAMDHTVNVEAHPSAVSVITVRHYSRVGVLAGLLNVIRGAGLNVEQMVNHIFAGGNAASATIHLAQPPTAETLAAIETVDNVISVTVASLTGPRPSIRPFDAYLPAPEVAADVAAPPLSSITVDRYEQLIAAQPHSILHVLRTAIDSAPGGGETDADPEDGLAHLRRMIEEGLLRHHDTPAFYVYRISTGAESHLGVVAEVSAWGLDDGSIRPHEDTRRETEDLVLEHLRTVRAHTDPVAMTYRADHELTRVLSRIADEEVPTLEFDSDDGAHQELWAVDDQAASDAIAGRLALLSRLYITDGHHRTAASLRFAQEQAARSGHTGSEAYNYLPVVLFADDQVGVLGYHRSVTGLDRDLVERLLGELEEIVTVEELAVPWAEEARPSRQGVVGMTIDGKWYRLGLPPVRADDPIIDTLDTVRLQRLVLGPLLGVEEPRLDSRLEYIPGPAGLGELARREGSAGFAMHPPGVSAVMAVADAGEIMPPKSTWFEPKVRAGIVVRRF